MDDNRRVTMDDIAKALGVSKNAVSLALRGKRGVSESLRARVLETARRLQYGQITQDSTTRYIAAMLPRYLSTATEHSFYHQVCFHMEARARHHGCQLLITSISEEEEVALTLPPLVYQLPCAGVMTIGNLSLPYCRAVSQLGLPYIMVDQYYDELAAHCVTTTNATGAYLLTKHLIENGHRHIEYLGRRRATASLRDRWEGYRRAMDEHGLPIHENVYQQEPTKDQPHEIELLTQTLSEMDRFPTAFFCGHDNTAITLISLLESQGLHVPQDISVVGFDDIQQPGGFRPGLTTYRTRKEDIANTAIDLFVRLPLPTVMRVAIYGEVIVRESVERLDEPTR